MRKNPKKHMKRIKALDVLLLRYAEFLIQFILFYLHFILKLLHFIFFASFDNNEVHTSIHGSYLNDQIWLSAGTTFWTIY